MCEQGQREGEGRKNERLSESQKERREGKRRGTDSKSVSRAPVSAAALIRQRHNVCMTEATRAGRSLRGMREMR